MRAVGRHFPDVRARHAEGLLLPRESGALTVVGVVSRVILERRSRRTHRHTPHVVGDSSETPEKPAFRNSALEEQVSFLPDVRNRLAVFLG